MNLTEVKNLTIPEGTVSKIGIQTNQVPLSIDKDGSIFNGTGYIDGYRLSSSGELKIYESLYYVSAATGFIPAHGGDEIRIVGCWWYQPFNSLNYICAYDSQFNFIGACIPSGGYYTKNIATSISGNNSVGIIKLINDDNIAYVRLSYVSYDRQSVGSKLIVLTYLSIKSCYQPKQMMQQFTTMVLAIKTATVFVQVVRKQQPRKVLVLDI